MGVPCVNTDTRIGIAPPPSPSPFQGEGKKILTAVTVEPLWVPRQSRGFTLS